MPLRYRTAPDLIIRFQDGALVVLDPIRDFEVTTEQPGPLITLLAALGSWTTLADAEPLLDAEGLSTDTLDELTDLGLLEREDQPRSSHWTALDRLLHLEQSQGAYNPGSTTAAPSAFKRPAPKEIALTRRALPPVSLAQTLATRRSLRSCGPGELDLCALETLLDAGLSVQDVFSHPEMGTMSRRPTPSAGARHPIECYVLARRISNIRPGLYHYNALDHALAPVCEFDDTANDVLDWAQAALDPRTPSPPQALLLFTAVFERTFFKYKGTGYALICKDLGAIYQTLYLVATALDLSICGLGGTYGPAFANWIGTDPLTEDHIGSMILGKS